LKLEGRTGKTIIPRELLIFLCAGWIIGVGRFSIRGLYFGAGRSSPRKSGNFENMANQGVKIESHNGE
jgi:hypothetical protein